VREQALQRWWFRVTVSSIARDIMSYQHGISLTLRNFQERLMAAGEEDDGGELQVRPSL
jgi:hypothetical protein